jgi:aminopeptidase N
MSCTVLSPLWASALSQERAADGWRLTYIDLRVTVLPASHALAGHVRLVASRSGRTTVDLPVDLSDSMTVDSVRVGGARSEAAVREPGRIRVPFAALMRVTPEGQPGGGRAGRLRPAGAVSSREVEVWFHGSPPRRAVAFTEHAGSPRIASYGLPNSARQWWPTLDAPSQKADSADIYVTAPESLTVASNGRIVRRSSNGDGTATSHWAVRYPIYSDVISIAVARYAVLRGSYRSTNGRTVPLAFFVFPDDSVKAVEDFSIVPGVLAFLESRLGPYPFPAEKYGIAEFDRPSFREHQTVPSLGASFITGKHAADAVIAHEAAHQWFGNSITVPGWEDIWLNESFSEFMAWEWLRHARGKVTYDSVLADARKQEYHGALAHVAPDDFASMFGPLTFQKGPLVLSMLRDLMGERAFGAAMRSYVKEHSRKLGSTADFRRACERASGKQLGAFFEKWVDGAVVDRF